MTQQATKLNTQKIVKASARNLRISPRKIRLLANLVRGLYVDQALNQLTFASQKGADFLAKAIKSAAANAVNNFSLKPDNLYIKTVTCDMGTAMKRYFPRARGSAFIIRRKTSHINVELGEKQRNAKSKSRLDIFRKNRQAETVNLDKLEATEKKEVKEHIRQHSVKSDEQVKMNKIQNKRRIFNRKSGE